MLITYYKTTRKKKKTVWFHIKWSNTIWICWSKMALWVFHELYVSQKKKKEDRFLCINTKHQMECKSNTFWGLKFYSFVSISVFEREKNDLKSVDLIYENVRVSIFMTQTTHCIVIIFCGYLIYLICWQLSHSASYFVCMHRVILWFAFSHSRSHSMFITSTKNISWIEPCTMPKNSFTA